MMVSRDQQGVNHRLISCSSIFTPPPYLLCYARPELPRRRGACAADAVRRSEETTPSSSQAQSAGERGLRYGLRDGACQAITQGSGEQYLSAFALLLHASPFQLSVLSALPQLIGTGAQLVSVKLLQWFPNRKALISAGTVGQAFTWIPIVLLPLLLPQWGPWLVVGGSCRLFCLRPLHHTGLE